MKPRYLRLLLGPESAVDDELRRRAEQLPATCWTALSFKGWKRGISHESPLATVAGSRRVCTRGGKGCQARGVGSR
jgi:hypothetical protein